MLAGVGTDSLHRVGALTVGSDSSGHYTFPLLCWEASCWEAEIFWEVFC